MIYYNCSKENRKEVKIMTKKEIEAIIKLVNVTEPFYASDYDIAGGTISALDNIYEFVKATGNTKEYFINLYDDVYKKVTVKEWQVIPSARMRVLKQVQNELMEMKKLIHTWEHMTIIIHF